MKKIFAFCCFTFCSLIGMGQVELSFDYSNADSTIEFLKKKNTSTAEINAFLSTNGVKAIIKKIKSNDSTGLVVLNKLSEGKKLSGRENDFQYEFIQSNLAAMENFVQAVKAYEQVIRDSVQSLAAFLPAGKKLPVKVCFLLGGYSSGFTFSDPGVFYVGMHQYKYDVKSIVNTCQHEIFHNVQNLYQDRMPLLKKLESDNDLPSLYAFYLLQNFFTEGTAEYVADIDKADPTSPNIKLHREHAAVNNYRMAENFYLADKLLTDAYDDPERSDPGMAYGILFDWNWNNPGYAMGKLMTKALTEAYGQHVLKKYLKENPLQFIKDYIVLAKKDPKKYPNNFSEKFEKMIDEVLKKTGEFYAGR